VREDNPISTIIKKHSASYFAMSTTKTMIPLLLLLLLLLSPLSTTASTAAYPTILGTIDTSVSSSQPDNLIPIRNEIYGNGKIFDISHRYINDMPVWDSKDGLGKFLSLPASMKNGSLANNSEMKLPTHTGTHVDSPGHVFDHYFDSGFDVDTLDLEVLNGDDKEQNLVAGFCYIYNLITSPLFCIGFT
jgi:hypothetical protein